MCWLMSVQQSTPHRKQCDGSIHICPIPDKLYWQKKAVGSHMISYRAIKCTSDQLLDINYKMPVSYILSSVWVRLSIFSPLSIMQYVGLYVFSLPISLVMIERIYILCLIIIIKSEVWNITHCLGLGHETMVSALCLSIFLFLLHKDEATVQSMMAFITTCLNPPANSFVSGKLAGVPFTDRF